MKTRHTMATDNLDRYCKSKIHSLFISSGVKQIKIVPAYKRDKKASETEKTDKLFNFKRPTAEIVDGIGYLYVFPGKNYLDHYAKIYRQQGFDVEVGSFSERIVREAIDAILPTDLPDSDVTVLGYVEPLAGGDGWRTNGEVAWKLVDMNGTKAVFVGVTFSYWGDIIYYLSERLAKKTERLIYVGKLGSLHQDDIPNKTIASGDRSLVEGEMVVWDNIFAHSPLVTQGAHASLPSVLDETYEWFMESRDSYRFVDPEIGWIAKACNDNSIEFSYLHLVTDNLHGNFLEDLTNERDDLVLEKRLQYVGIIKSVLWHAIVKHETALYPAVLKAQQKRVDRGLMQPLERNWKACLSFAYHTQEEAWEIVRELPRREWKDQTVDPDKLLSEMADTQIQLLTTLAYAGFSDADLEQAVLEKLGAKRADWK